MALTTGSRIRDHHALAAVPTCAAVAIAAAGGCSAEKTVTSEVVWDERLGTCEWVSAGPSDCFEGREDTYNTYIVKLYRMSNQLAAEYPSGCRHCTSGSRCELVAVECRCTAPIMRDPASPSGDPDVVAAGLGGLRFGDLSAEHQYCVVVIMADIEGNDLADGISGGACPAEQACTDLVAPSPTYYEDVVPRSRMCSTSTWAALPGMTIVDQPFCRSDGGPLTSCLGVSSTCSDKLCDVAGVTCVSGEGGASRPVCPMGQTPSVEDSCWGPCVPSSECQPILCDGAFAASQCPLGWTCFEETTGWCGQARLP